MKTLTPDQIRIGARAAASRPFDAKTKILRGLAGFGIEAEMSDDQMMDAFEPAIADPAVRREIIAAARAAKLKTPPPLPKPGTGGRPIGVRNI